MSTTTYYVLNHLPPLKKKIKNNIFQDEFNFDYWINSENFESGGFGTIYETCRIYKEKKDCQYVAKKVNFNDDQDKYYFFLEAALADRAGKKGYGPKIFTSFLCNKRQTGVIIMERFQYTLDDFLLQNKHSKIYQYLKNHPEKIFEPVVKMHQDKIVHLDLFSKNMLVNIEKDGNIRIVVTDFGRFSRPLISLPQYLTYCDILGLIFGEVLVVDKDGDLISIDNRLPQDLHNIYMDYCFKNNLLEKNKKILDFMIQSRINIYGKYDDVYYVPPNISNQEIRGDNAILMLIDENVDEKIKKKFKLIDYSEKLKK